MFLVELKKCSWTLCVPQCSMIWSLTTSSTAVLITVSLSFPPSPLPLTRSTALSSPAGRALAENTQEELSTFWENETEIKPYILCLAVQTIILFNSGESCLFLSINSKNKITFSPWVFCFYMYAFNICFYPEWLTKEEQSNLSKSQQCQVY